MSWYRRLLNLTRPLRLSRDLTEELTFHLAHREDDLVASGMTREEAKRVARQQFGNLQLGKERTRDMDVVSWIESITKDVRFAARSLGRKPLFTMAAVITLAIGIGASTVMFSVVNAVILRPLPYANADELIRMYGILRDNFTGASVSPDDFLDYRSESRTFSGIAASFTGLIPMTVTGVPEPFRVEAALVSGNYFDVFGQSALIGRGLNIQDEATIAPSVVVISSALWRTLYAGSEDVLGRQLRLSGPIAGGALTVVGVMPDSFDAPYDPDVWLAMPLTSSEIRGRASTFSVRWVVWLPA